MFVTGTDTGVGKTVVAAILVAGLGAVYWKPVQCGLENITDTEWVRRATGLPPAHFAPEAFRLRQPLSPHAAAQLEGASIDLARFDLPSSDVSNSLIVEGAGGVLVPLNRRDTMVDLMSHLGLPVLLVARSTLGTINHTLLSLEELRRRGLEVLGVVMNGPDNRSNREAVEHFGRTRVLAAVEPLERMDPPSLLEVFRTRFQSPAAGRPT